VTCNSTHTESTVVFPLQNGYANAPQCYVICTLLFLLHTEVCVSSPAPSRKRQIPWDSQVHPDLLALRTNLIHVTLLGNIIWRWFLYCWLIC